MSRQNPHKRSRVGVHAPRRERRRVSLESRTWPNLEPARSIFLNRAFNCKLIFSCLKGLFGILWYTAWFLFVFESPSSHPTITKEEQEYIELSAINSAEVIPR